MVTDTMALVFVGIVLILPWSLRQAGLFDKVKRWYKVLFASLLIGLLPVALGASSAASIIGQEIAYQITLVVEMISLILFIVSMLGIIKTLLVE